MTTLRLFHRDDPFRQIEAREFSGGELAIGRDPEGGWAVDDPSRTLSRRHCVLSQAADGLEVRDTSANGVFLGRDRARVPKGASTPLTGETLHLGEFLIVVEPSPLSAPAPAEAPAAAPADQPLAAAGAPGEGALLESFCQGARLDVSAFSGEDPSEVLRRLGAVYRQMVSGLVALMDERTQVRGEHWMDRTAVKADGNNPFRWARADRVAVDLLRESGLGFLVGAAAVEASFADLCRHQRSLGGATRSALAALLEALSPAALEATSRGRSMLEPKAAASWSNFVREHERLANLANDDPRNPINKAFRAAYEQAGSATATRKAS